MGQQFDLRGDQFLKRDLVFDFGLHKGEDTAFYLEKGFRVVSFEANPELAQACRNRFSAQIETGKLIIMEGAVAPASAGDTLTFFVNERSVWGTIDRDWVERNEKAGAASKKIIARRIDVEEVIREFGMPFYMKIDIEGADQYVLEVLASFPDRPKYISIESSKEDLGEVIAECDRLRALGYSRFKAVQQEYIPGRQGVFTRRNGEQFSYTFPADSSGPFGDDIRQSWVSYEGILDDYRTIFRKYRWLGSDSPLMQLPGLHKLLWHAGKLANIGFPGWYDTHAALDDE